MQNEATERRAWGRGRLFSGLRPGVKIVADENADKQIVDRFRADGHDVLFIAELNPGIDDQTVRSRQANAILPTADKDFGDLVFRQRLLHSGVLLIRLAGLKPDINAGLVATTFDQHAKELSLGNASVR